MNPWHLEFLPMLIFFKNGKPNAAVVVQACRRITNRNATGNLYLH